LFTSSTLLAESGLALDHVRAADACVVMVVTANRTTVPCPVCGHLAHRIHSHYQRTVTDLPIQGVPVRLALHTRRFYCDEPTCPRRIFAERFSDFVAAGARRSMRLDALYLVLGLVLGSAAGARLATDLGLSISPDTLLRLTTATPVAAQPTPRVLGVDDWSWRKGRRWGTILVDLERHQTIDRCAAHQPHHRPIP